MDAYMITFLKKIVAALYTGGVTSIPFSGKEFHEGMQKIEDVMQKELPEEQFEKISDIFIKTPVQEAYNNVRDSLMTLNGDTISFVGVDNPYWQTATIKMNDFYARKVLGDKEICDIDTSIIKEATKEFCEAAGVTVWED